MKARKPLVIAAVAAIAAIGWIATAPERIAPSSLGPHEPNLDNGRTMFFAGGCASCHAVPGSDDRLRLGGGLGLVSPFGTFYAPNISPHPERGIGRWSEADFVTAMAKGISPDGRHYYPAFPYTSYQRMRLADTRDLFAFIKSLAAVDTASKPHEVAFPFNVRRGLGVWKFLYLDGRPFVPDPTKPADFNRGAYLVEGPGHCAECHSPRTRLGGRADGLRYSGGPSPDGKRWVPNITQHKQALASWSVGDIKELLTTGQTPEFSEVGGDMAAVVKNAAQLSDADRAAMAVYVKSLPAIEGLPRPQKQ